MRLTAGRLIAFEGIDGAGKRTQIELLVNRLKEASVNCVDLSFPQYNSVFGQVVGKYLRGEFGELYQVSPYLSALPYALDRFQARGTIVDHLENGINVIVDRYVGSNMAHHSARLPVAEREEFIRWLWTVEYEYLGLPREDLTLFLNMPAEVGYKMVGKKPRRPYMSTSRDIHETDLSYQNAVAQVFEDLAHRNEFWITISTTNTAGKPLPKETIHLDVIGAVRDRLLLSI